MPVPADRIDSSPTLLQWRREVAERSDGIGSTLAGILNQLERNGAPVIQWLSLLQPIMCALNEVQRISDESSPVVALGSVLSLANAVAALQRADTSDPELSALIGLLDCHVEVGSRKPSSPRHIFADKFAHSLESLLLSSVILLNLAEYVGVHLQHLPLFLYRHGRLFRRCDGLSVTESTCAAGTVKRNITMLPRSCAALLWKADGLGLVTGDLRFRIPGRRDSESLHGPPSDADYHWLDAENSLRWESEAPNGVALELAAYARVCDPASFKYVRTLSDV